ncbi:hypothetical protein POM88_010135 [Heracleum sosnowskyi]|uniref:Uncharacterized protein n=1 Tax=Heracleum sosnowskyi TaxID=360622 RepID=A0AAD8JD60_9APIA|nr:hypothetical protein POM88_010135 [Heracleum sosnowskyi]
MKLLTLVEVCDVDAVFFENVDEVDENKKGESDQEKVLFDHDITFAEIKEALKISTDEVTSWINKVRTGIAMKELLVAESMTKVKDDNVGHLQLQRAFMDCATLNMKSVDSDHQRKS